MGSGAHRKPTDTTRINLPIEKTGNTMQGEGAGGDNSVSPDINNICPVRFRVKLSVQDLAEGTALLINDNDIVTYESMVVGNIPPRIVKTLETCLGLGITYDTRTVVEKGIRYAEFSQ